MHYYADSRFKVGKIPPTRMRLHRQAPGRLALICLSFPHKRVHPREYRSWYVLGKLILGLYNVEPKLKEWGNFGRSTADPVILLWVGWDHLHFAGMGSSIAYVSKCVYNEVSVPFPILLL